MDRETRRADADGGDRSTTYSCDASTTDIASSSRGTTGGDAAINGTQETTATTDGLEDNTGAVSTTGGDAAGELGVVEGASGSIDIGLLGATDGDVAADISNDAATASDGLKDSTGAGSAGGENLKGEREFEISAGGGAGAEATELNGAGRDAADPAATTTDGLVNHARREETGGLQDAAAFYKGEGAAGASGAVDATAEDDSAAAIAVAEADHASAAADGLHEIGR